MKIGIALATYNPPLDFLRQQISSIINQSHGDWICVVSDESASTDLGAEIQSILSQDPRFEYTRNPGPRHGVMANFENALHRIPKDCQAVALADQDDTWHPEKLATLASALDRQPAARLVHSDLQLIDEAGQLLHASCWRHEARDFSRPDSLLELVFRNRVTGCATLFQRDLLSLALPFPTDTEGRYLHDQWLGCWALIHGRIHHASSSAILDCTERLVSYRQHGRNVIGAQNPRGSGGWLGKIRRIFEISKKGRYALEIRQRLARDLLQRTRERAPELANALATELSPILKPSFAYFLKRLIGSRLRFPETGLWIQILVAIATGQGLRAKSRTTP